MAEALKIVSVQRGHDPRDFSLAAFGGAGPLHATALAEELGIATVVCPPIPGAFSALGLVGTDLRRDYVHTVYTTAATADPSVLETAFRAMETEGSAMLERASIDAGRRRFDRSVDARYAGQSYELNVPVAGGAVDAAAIDGIAEAFHARHAQTYGHDNRAEPVQFVSLRVAAIGIIPPLTIRQQPAAAGTPSAKPPRDVWFRSTGTVEAQVHDRARIAEGTDRPRSRCNREPRVDHPDPARLASAHGWRRFHPDGADKPGSRTMTSPRQKDPAAFEIAKNALFKIAEEMRVILCKTAYSPILKSAGDFSCGVFDAKGAMVAQGIDLPIHLGSMPDAVRAIVSVFGGDVHEGDVFIHNDPYFGGSHLPDVNVIRPAFHEGLLLGYTCLRAHWPDVGSATPGSYGAVTEIYGEGLRLPPLRLVSKGVMNADLEKVILTNVRTPAERRGDLGAQLAATLRGVQRLQELARRYGAREIVETMAEVMDYSERLMRVALVDLPDGEGTFEDFCDGDGIADDADGNDARFRVRMHIKKSGDRLVVDFAGSDPQVKGPMNAPLSVTASGVYCGLKMAVDPGSLIPPNSGCWRAISIEAPKASVVNAALSRAGRLRQP